MAKDYGQYIKAMAKIQGKDVLPDVRLYKPRKKRAKETQPRNQPERKLRNEAIAYFRKHGWIVHRLENSVWGKNNVGLPDLHVTNLNRR